MNKVLLFSFLLLSSCSTESEARSSYLKEINELNSCASKWLDKMGVDGKVECFLYDYECTVVINGENNVKQFQQLNCSQCKYHNKCRIEPR